MRKLRTVWLLIGLLAFAFPGQPGEASADRQAMTRPAPLQPLALGDQGEPVRALQQLLSVFGYYSAGEITGVFEEGTAEALAAFQRAYGLPPTGVLDAPTLRVLGGDNLTSFPRFLYRVRKNDSLSAIARRFGSSMPWIVRLNPHIKSVHMLREGEELLIPIDFPLPSGVSAGRMQVLQDRFLGSYGMDVAFSAAGEIVRWQVDALRAKGFDATLDEGSEYGITLRGRGVVLGRMTFTPPASGTSIQIDIGLLFSEEQQHRNGLLENTGGCTGECRG